MWYLIKGRRKSIDNYQYMKCLFGKASRPGSAVVPVSAKEGDKCYREVWIYWVVLVKWAEEGAITKCPPISTFEKVIWAQ